MTLRLQLGVYESPGGTMIADFSHNGIQIAPSSGEHGFEALTFDVPLSLDDSFRHHNQLGGKWLQLSNGAASVWEGFIERVGVTAVGIAVTAMGEWRGLNRLKYTALWSAASADNWEILTNDMLSSATPERYKQDNKNRLYIAPRKNENFSSSGQSGVWGFRIPDGSSRQIVGVEFDYTLDAPTDWVMILERRDSEYAHVSTHLTVTSSGSAITRSINRILAGCDSITVRMKYNTTAADYTGETGDAYLKISNVRVITTTTNRIDTTTTTTITAGADRVVTPASMTGIYVGQRLFFDQALNTSESVEVTAVTSTTFTATFANAYSGTTTIHTHVVRPDEIVEDIISKVSALDGTNLSSSTALVDNPEIDLLNEIYEDASPIRICTKLAGLGDASGNVWEVGVMNDQILYYRQRASAGRHWYVDPIELEVTQDLGALANSVYATFRDANGRTLRTAVSENATSQAKYSIEAQTAVRVNTTNEAMAELYRDVALTDGATPAPQVGFLVDRVFDATGAQYPNYEPRNGDMVTLRSLSPVLSSDIDRIRTFRLSGHSYTADFDALTMIPERPLPSLARMIARQGEGI